MAKPIKNVKDKKTDLSINPSVKAVKKFFPDRFLSTLLLSGVLILFVLLITAIGRRINVAKVNGQTISRLEYYKELEAKEGNSILEDLITKKIIFQEAKNNNISVSPSDIEAELSKIRDTVSAQGSTLEEVLAYQGITYNQLLDNIRIQKFLEQLLKNSINITDEEIKLRYEENKDIYGKDKTFEELKEDIRFQLYQEKITAAYRNWIEEKRNNSVIEKYL